MGQIKNIKLHIVTDIKSTEKMWGSRYGSQLKCLLTSNNSPMRAQPWLRNISTTCVVNHTPGLKKKGGPKPQMKEKQKERWMAKLQNLGFKVPPDPSLFPDPKLQQPDRIRAAAQLTEEEIDERALLTKEWARHQMQCHREDLKLIAEKIRCRNQALKELKRESQYLYDEAMKVDKLIFPLTLNGPLETPPQEGYEPPDFVD